MHKLGKMQDVSQLLAFQTSRRLCIHRLQLHVGDLVAQHGYVSKVGKHTWDSISPCTPVLRFSVVSIVSFGFSASMVCSRSSSIDSVSAAVLCITVMLMDPAASNDELRAYLRVVQDMLCTAALQAFDRRATGRVAVTGIAADVASGC